MSELQQTSRVAAAALAFALAFAACGDDDAAGADPERFCAINDEIEALGDPFEQPPDEASATIRGFKALVDEAVDVAPDEIRPSVEAVADSFQPFLDFFEARDFDVADVDEAEVDALFAQALSSEAEDPGAAMDEWIAANCSA